VHEDYAARQKRWDEAVRPKDNATILKGAKIIRVQCEDGHWNRFDNGVMQIELVRFRCGAKGCKKQLKGV
jgi:hypothetical protein